MKYSKDIISRIGNTPLVKINLTENSTVNIFGKMEFLQPGGSVKDRAALQIITDAVAEGKLKQGQSVVEMTSGNMGAGLAVVCAALGFPFTAVMPEGNSPERRKILNAFDAEIVLVPQVEGSPGMVTGKDVEAAVWKAKEIASETGAFYVDQFNNYSCVKGHYNTTGPEIWNDLEGKVDAFVSVLGSGGTFVGTSKYLKEKNPSIKCFVVEPKQAAIIKTGKIENPRHIIQGTSYSLVPPHWVPELLEDVVLVTDEEVLSVTKQLHKECGLYVGYSAGANVAGCLKLIESGLVEANSNVVTILCDTAFKYSDL